MKEDLHFNPESGLLEVIKTTDPGIDITQNFPLFNNALPNTCVMIISGSAYPINSNYNNDIAGYSRPVLMGVVLNGGLQGQRAIVAVRKGMKYTSNVSLGISGTLLYLGKSGVLTTVCPSKAGGDKWYGVVGYRINEYEFIFDPRDCLEAPDNSIDYIYAGTTLYSIKEFDYQSSINIDPYGLSTAIITLEGNCNIDIQPGLNRQKILLEIKQDNIGGRLINWGSSILFGNDIQNLDLSISPNKTDYIGLIYVNDKWRIIAYSRGY